MKKQELIQKLMAKKAARASNSKAISLCIVECCEGHCGVGNA